MYFHIVNKLSELEDIVSRIEQAGEVVVDTETTSLATHSSTIELVGVGLCFDNSNAYYIPFNNEKQEISIDDLKITLENPAIEKIGHNIKYDARVFNRFGINLKNISFDTLLASYCLYGDRMKHNLDDQVLHHFNYVKVRTKDVIPRKTKKLTIPTMKDCAISKVAAYCCEDAFFTRKLYKLYKDIFTRPQFKSASDLYYDIELPLLPVLIDMECAGVAIDLVKIVELNTKFQDYLTEETNKVTETLGRPLALTNSNDVAKAIFEELRIQDKLNFKPVLTPTGKFKTDKHTLKALQSDSFVASILNIKKLNKLISTYMMSFPQYISDYTGRLHAFFNQAITATGRLSSSEPNLQNQPSRDELGKEIRALYVSRWASIGGKILAADYSQAELRILAHMADEQTFIDIFHRGADPHVGVAAKIHNKDESLVTKPERTSAKTINFGILYGMGPKKLATELGITIQEAKSLIDQYLGTLTSIRKFIIDSEKFLSKNGYTQTFFGRRRFIPKIFSDDTLEQWAARREGTNHIIQGTNADIIKKAMVKCRQEFNTRGLKSLLILQVHDELVFDVHPDELEEVKNIVLNCMQNVVQFKIPMIADARYGNSWADAH